MHLELAEFGVDAEEFAAGPRNLYEGPGRLFVDDIAEIDRNPFPQARAIDGRNLAR
ncbi:MULTISPECIES: hypothetical protein [Mycobacterium]|uniref:Uncharacterized protein n=1 Tax=Mycobacterium paragordonae TaxID=1389713 RepID=A0ABQ1CF28_9MYCO|nr:MULTISPECIES: hypothetical protein [Mycobacterium]GFG83076.1 hypothetical protein MPRG_63520 [Mycobacterium paragordonae]